MDARAWIWGQLKYQTLSLYWSGGRHGCQTICRHPVRGEPTEPLTLLLHWSRGCGGCLKAHRTQAWARIWSNPTKSQTVVLHVRGIVEGSFQKCPFGGRPAIFRKVSKWARNFSLEIVYCRTFGAYVSFLIIRRLDTSFRNFGVAVGVERSKQTSERNEQTD